LNPPHPALQAYRIHNRRSMRIYAAVIAAVVLAGFAAVKLAYARGELNHVDKASAPAPTPLPTAVPASSVSLKWRTDDRPAGGNPYSDGVVVSYDQHTVNGRDAVTGAVRWHYRRSDQTLCSVVQQDRTTIAIYNRHGNCDEATGFVTATGEPKWYRTLTDLGITTAASAPNVVLIVGDRTVHVIDNAGGLDRWAWAAPDGCLVDRALGGSLGVLIGYHCGIEKHLMLRELTGSAEKWKITVSGSQVPFAAHAFIAAIDPSTGVVTTYTQDKGAVARQLPPITTPGLAQAIGDLPRAQTAVEGSGATAQGTEFIRAGAVFAFSARDNLAWSAPATGSPWQISDSLIAVPTAGGVALFRVGDGHLERTIDVPVNAAVTAYPVGAGLLLAGTTMEMYQ
jgi:hypothetical protein